MSPIRLAAVRQTLSWRRDHEYALILPVCTDEEVAWLIGVLDRQEAVIEELVKTLEALESAADPFAADQTGATDPRCGLVQPVSVADCTVLNAAMKATRGLAERLSRNAPDADEVVRLRDENRRLNQCLDTWTATAAATERRIAEQDAVIETYAERIRLAQESLVATGYFKPHEVGPDIAPRIAEYSHAMKSPGVEVHDGPE